MLSAQEAAKSEWLVVVPDIVVHPVDEPVNHALVKGFRTLCGAKFPKGLLATSDPRAKTCYDCMEQKQWSEEILRKLDACPAGG